MTDTAPFDMGPIDMGPIDMGLTDMAPFFARYDQRTRLLFVAVLSATLVMSAVIATHVLTNGVANPRLVGPVWALGIAIPPLFTAGWWTFAELMAHGRRKTMRSDGRLPASEVDARNGMRIANAGFAYNIAVTVTVFLGQVFMALLVFGYPPVGTWPSRIIMIVTGAVTIYLGNLWPRMPVARTPDRKGAVRMKANRFSGWLMVTCGLLIILLGLFLPLVIPLHRP